MYYPDFVKGKLRLTENDDLIDAAVVYLAKEYPVFSPPLLEYSIVDEWLNNICLRWNVRVREVDLGQSRFLGKLEPISRGFILHLNKKLFLSMRRYVVAHELAHILSFNTRKDCPTSEIPHSYSEEQFCNSVARALLLPKSLIDPFHVDPRELTDESILDIITLQKRYKVTAWNIIIKSLETINSPYLIGVFWGYDTEKMQNPEKFDATDKVYLKILDHYNHRSVFIPNKDRAIFLSDNPLKKVRKSKKSYLPTNLSPKIAYRLKGTHRGVDLVSIGSIYKQYLPTTSFYYKTTTGEFVIQIIDTRQSKMKTNTEHIG